MSKFSTSLERISIALVLLSVSFSAQAVNIEELSRDRKYQSYFVFEESTRDEANLEVPETLGQFKSVGPSDEHNALAAKLGMLKRAKHTIDMAYYIFKRDIVGYSILHEACEAVQRGVDVRILVDSVGSIHYSHGELKALRDCEKRAGFMIDENGNPTMVKASVQTVVFNPLLNLPGRVRGTARRLWNITVGLVFPKYKIAPIRGWINRRMHDKLILIDGRFPGEAMAMMGGRNISIDYYGLDKNGKHSEDTYKDMEVLIKDVPKDSIKNDKQFGSILSNHYDRIFKHLGNKRIRSLTNLFSKKYTRKMDDNYNELMNNAEVSTRMAHIEDYLSSGFVQANGRWVHELQNLTARKATSNYKMNENKNPNSIEAQLRKALAGSNKKMVIVSPYLFFRKTGIFPVNVDEQVNEFANLQQWLANDKERTIEIITNSVLTSDNFMAQSVIDQEVAPELTTLQKPAKTKPIDNGKLIGEFEGMSDEIMSQEDFNQILKDGRIKIWEMGKLDAVEFGGEEIYGKLHAKMVEIDDETSFVSTFNGDFRSRDYNSETGLFIYDEAFTKELSVEVDRLRDRSVLWGTPEWKEIRKRIVNLGGIKGLTTKKQRQLYKLIVNMPSLYWAL